MGHIISDNKQRKDPWRLLLANFDKSNELINYSLDK
jgi:hypothetical protein